MNYKYYNEILLNQRKFIFVGESGSGKSELSINFVIQLKKLTDKKVHFFDMDQTKPLYRSREAKAVIEEAGIIFHTMQQFQDAPVIPHAINETLNNENNIVVLDIGGNANGAVSIGQFTDILNQLDTKVFYVANYYRPFSRDKRNVEITLNQIKAALKVDNLSILSNPNMGMRTTLKDVEEGHRCICEMINELGYDVSQLCVSEWLYEDAVKNIAEEIIQIKPYIKYSWIKSN